MPRPRDGRGLPRNYWLLLGAFFVSTTGDWLYRLALPLLVLQMTGSALGTAAVYALEHLPFLLFSLFGGVAADRLDRRRLLVATDLVSVAVVGSLAVLVWLQVQQVWMVYVAAFVVAGAPPFYHPTFQSLIPSLVDEAQLPKANSRLQVSQSLLDMLGPALAGGVIAALGVTAALLLDALSFAASGLVIACIAVGRPGRPASSGTGMWSALSEGIAYLRGQPALLWGCFVGAGSTFGILLVESNMVYYLVHFHGLPATAVGLVFAAQGAGAVLGAWLAPLVARRVQLGTLVVAGMVGAGLATALLLVLLSVPGIALAWAGVGLSVMVLAVSWFTFRHRLVPDELLGRVVALTRMLAFVALPVAPLVGGGILGLTGSMFTLVALSAAVQVTAGVAAWFTPLRRHVLRPAPPPRATRTPTDSA